MNYICNYAHDLLFIVRRMLSIIIESGHFSPYLLASDLRGINRGRDVHCYVFVQSVPSQLGAWA
jgi:hypothetical protein